MNFNLSKSNGTAVQRLQPWTINDVEFSGVDFRSGTSQQGNDWKAIQFKFKGANGTFEHMVFCPGDKGDERMTGTSNGRNWELPSAMEQLVHTLAHVLGVLNPAGFEKLKGIELDLPKDFDKLYQYVKKVLDPKVGTKTQLKLIGNNKGYAAIPNFININRDTHESYISNNWLGENLAFSAYELQQKDKASKAKPTNMTETSTNTESEIPNDDPEDWDL